MTVATLPKERTNLKWWNIEITSSIPTVEYRLLNRFVYLMSGMNKTCDGLISSLRDAADCL
jgi:hypothetical protein